MDWINLTQDVVLWQATVNMEKLLELIFIKICNMWVWDLVKFLHFCT
jgi:hypothetical protein